MIRSDRFSFCIHFFFLPSPFKVHTSSGKLWKEIKYLTNRNDRNHTRSCCYNECLDKPIIIDWNAKENKKWISKFGRVQMWVKFFKWFESMHCVQCFEENMVFKKEQNCENHRLQNWYFWCDKHLTYVSRNLKWNYILQNK